MRIAGVPKSTSWGTPELFTHVTVPPTEISDDVGLNVTAPIVTVAVAGGAVVTVTTAVPARVPSAGDAILAVMVALPTARPVTTPAPVTVAMFVLSDVNVAAG